MYPASRRDQRVDQAKPPRSLHPMPEGEEGTIEIVPAMPSSYSYLHRKKGAARLHQDNDDHREVAPSKKQVTPVTFMKEDDDGLYSHTMTRSL